MEATFYEYRPFLFFILGTFAALHVWESVLMGTSGLILVAAATAVIRARYINRKTPHRIR